MFKKLLLTTLCLTAFLSAQTTNPTLSVNDGPYIFYKNNMLHYQTVDYSKNSATTDSIDISAKADKKFSCQFNDSKLNFSFSLKKAIKTEPAIYKGVNKIFAVSDIEGEFLPFRELLLAGGVIDSDYNWQFGTGHLVICGDMFDRGELVTEGLWLLYSLEEKAEKAGGKVHYILGNHDMMNISGDFRYVHEKYQTSSKLLGKSYDQLYTQNTELGRWIRSKNVIETIDSLLFVHGGISESINSLPYTLPQINDSMRTFISTTAPLNKKAGIATALFGSNSPYWFRGYFKDEDCSTTLNGTAKKFNTSIVFTGHTVVDSIAPLHGGKVIGVDTQHATGSSQGVLIENNQFTVIDKFGKRKKLK